MHGSAPVEQAAFAQHRMISAAVSYLHRDLEVANTLLDSITRIQDPDFKMRALRSARAAHRAMIAMIRQLNLSNERELDEILDALDALNFRLGIHGH
jgi:hypothetical protein